jgi:plasmid stabilization system protein ParE
VKIRILDEAERDLFAGVLFYEAQDPGLGDYFLDSISADIDSLQLFGGIHPVRSGRHCLLATKFPYAIYYKVVNRVVHVQAVLDCRRDPAWIEKRLK